MMRRRLLVQFGAASAERVASAVIQGLSLLLVARAVSPGQFGLLSGVLGAAWVGQTIFDLGLTTFIVRERATSRTNGIVATALQLYGRLSFALSLLTMCILLLLGIYVNSDFSLLLPLALWIGAERNADAWLSVAFADGDWRNNLANIALRRCFSLLSFITLGALGIDPLLAFSVGWAMASMGANILARRSVSVSLPEPVKIAQVTLLRETWPYWTHSLSMQVKNLDVSVASVLGGAYAAGIFAAAARLTTPLRILPTSLARAILPAATRSSKDGIQREFVLLCTAMLMGMTFVYLVILLLVPHVLPNLLGDPYRPAIVPLQVVLGGLPFAAGSSLLGSLLQAAGSKHVVAHLSLVTTVIYFPTLILGLNISGATGAAIALALSYVVQFVVYLVMTIRLFRAHHKVQGENAARTARHREPKLDRT
jgi:O-antigen/teichoic acid export membrane protein